MTAAHPLTLKAAAVQLGISEKTLRRRLAAPDRSGLDAVQLPTPQGYEWRLALTTPRAPPQAAAVRVDTARPDEVVADRVDTAADQPRCDRPGTRPGDRDQALALLRDIVVEQQRRLEAYAEERGRLVTLLARYEQATPPAVPAGPRPLRRWWRRITGRGVV